MLKTRITLLMALFAFLVACETVDVATLPGQARADLISPEGQLVGTATLTETSDGVALDLNLVNMPPGEHGFHIHEVGECVPPGFMSAGGHFALSGETHGFKTEKGPHFGDLRNITVADDGSLDVLRTVDGATLGEGEKSLMDRAIVIHAKPDDYESQPSGAAGERIACGVIEPGFTPPAATRIFPVQ